MGNTYCNENNIRIEASPISFAASNSSLQTIVQNAQEIFIQGNAPAGRWIH